MVSLNADTHIRLGNSLISWLGVALTIYALLLGVAAISVGFERVSGGEEGAVRIFAFARSPIVGVILGVLATALVQSSSTVTSVIVGLVAGGVPVAVAIPMVMGANMGTTITNTIVSLGNLHQRDSFNRSFQAATVHDFFNLYCIVLFLPIEIAFHPLERLAGRFAADLAGGSGAAVAELDFVSAVTKPPMQLTIRWLEGLPSIGGFETGGYLAIMLGVTAVILSVLLLGRLLRKVMLGRAKDVVQLAIGRSPLSGVASGAAITVLVQSSSTTTSLVVPLAGAGVLTTRQVFPFTMGANIGTCITALLAATSVGGDHQDWALQIALVHLLYNLAGVSLFLLIPDLQQLPVASARLLGDATQRNKGWAVVYLLAVFFVIPGAVLLREMLLSPSAPLTEVSEPIPKLEFSIE